jgi:hypothetical protein
MVFNKNQEKFPSETHEAIWNCGIHILPLEITLPQEVMDLLPPYLTKSCQQLQGFLLNLLNDMYENIDFYLPLWDSRLGIQNRFFRLLSDLALLGAAGEDNLTISRLIFEKYKAKGGYGSENEKNISFKDRLKMMERVGLTIEYKNGEVVFENEFYPNMFFAMREMAQITAREKASGDNSFTYCDFRKLCKSYKYDKYENALIFLCDSQKAVARTLDEIARKYKFVRSVKSGHCPGYNIIYKYRNMDIMQLGCMDNKLSLVIYIPYDKNNLVPIESFFNALEEDSQELKKFFLRRIHRCRLCSGNRNCAYSMKIYGNTNKLCWHWANVIGVETGVSMDEIPLVEKLLFHNIDMIGV